MSLWGGFFFCLSGFVPELFTFQIGCFDFISTDCVLFLKLNGSINFSKLESAKTVY